MGINISIAIFNEKSKEVVIHSELDQYGEYDSLKDMLKAAERDSLINLSDLDLDNLSDDEIIKILNNKGYYLSKLTYN